MKKSLLGAAIALLSSTVVYAQDYQFEVGGDYISAESMGIDVNGFGLNAQLHLDKVETSKGPLNEASFLDKSSFVSVAWATAKADQAGAESVDSFGFGGQFVTADDIIIQANYLDLENDSAIGFGVGTYLKENLAAMVSYQTYDEAELSRFSADIHGVDKLKGETSLGYNLGLAYLDSNGESAYNFSVGADYYLNNKLSIGAGLALLTADNYDETTVALRANYFVTPVAKVGASLTTVGQDGDGQAIQFSAAVRF